jgi:hypothetical protein
VPTSNPSEPRADAVGNVRNDGPELVAPAADFFTD